MLLAVCLVHGLTAMCAFLLALPVFWLVVGPKHFMLLAMLAGFFQLIPLLGSITLVGILNVYLFASGQTVAGWECLLIAVPLVVGVPDLLVRPYLSQRYGKVHGATMLAGFIIGIEVSRPAGLCAGPPAAGPGGPVHQADPGLGPSGALDPFSMKKPEPT